MKYVWKRVNEESGFTLVETLIAIVLMMGAFLAIAGAIPLAAMIHRGALERQIAMSLAQGQMEFFLTNPGPYAGATGTKADFQNTGQFPAGFTGTFKASAFGATGLTFIVVDVDPPHASRVELCAIDTTFTKLGN